MKNKQIANFILKILKHCEEKNCDCPLNGYPVCLIRHADFPRGFGYINKSDYPDLFFTKAESDVLHALHKYLPSRKITKKDGAYTKRHSKAIDSLKKKGIIAKDENDILYICE